MPTSVNKIKKQKKKDHNPDPTRLGYGPRIATPARRSHRGAPLLHEAVGVLPSTVGLGPAHSLPLDPRRWRNRREKEEFLVQIDFARGAGGRRRSFLPRSMLLEVFEGEGGAPHSDPPEKLEEEGGGVAVGGPRHRRAVPPPRGRGRGRRAGERNMSGRFSCPPPGLLLAWWGSRDGSRWEPPRGRWEPPGGRGHRAQHFGGEEERRVRLTDGNEMG